MDVIITSTYTSSQIANWASYKSLMLIFGPVFIIGLNNSIVREPSLSISLFWLGVIFSLFVYISLKLLSLLLNLSQEYYLEGILAYSISLLIAAYLRSHQKFIQAQFALNFWKILLFFISLSMLYYEVNNSLVLLCLVALVTSLFFSSIGMLRGIFVNPFSKRVTKENLSFSLKFMVSTFTALCAGYIEILALNYISSDESVAQYFKHFVIFTSVAVFASGFLGFYLTPLIRANANFSFDLYKKQVKLIVLCTVLFLFLNYLLGSLVFSFIHGEAPILILSVFLSFIATLRVIYVIPTSFMGAVAASKDLNNFLIFGLLGLVLFFLLFSLLIWGFHIESIYAVVIASGLNWTLRTAIAFRSFYKLECYVS